MAPVLAIFLPGAMELLIVAFVVLLLFGHRIPSMMRSMGRGVVEFKKGMNGIEDQSEEQPARKNR